MLRQPDCRAQLPVRPCVRRRNDSIKDSVQVPTSRERLGRSEDHPSEAAEKVANLWVESTTGAVAVGTPQLLPPLSSGGVEIEVPWRRLQSPLIEPDMRVRIRLSDKVSGHRSRKVGRHGGEHDESQRVVQVLVREATRARVAHLVLAA
jgi:hypothetical protein